MIKSPQIIHTEKKFSLMLSINPRRPVSSIYFKICLVSWRITSRQTLPSSPLASYITDSNGWSYGLKSFTIPSKAYQEATYPGEKTQIDVKVVPTTCIVKEERKLPNGLEIFQVTI